MDRRLFTKTALAAVAGITAGSATSVEASSKKSSKEKPDFQALANDEAEEQIKVIQSRRYYKHQGKKLQGKCASFLFFTDVHFVTPHLKKIRKFYQKHKKYLNDAIHLGDSVGNYAMGEFEFWEDFPEALNVIGNHDCYLNSAGRCLMMPQKQKFNSYFKRYVEGWKVTLPADAEEKGRCYWHKDYEGFLRVIGTDSMNLRDDAQYEWFVNLLKKSKEEKRAVLIVTHISPICEEMLDCNFSSLDYRKSKILGFKEDVGCDRYVKAVDDFISSGGEFVSWICGHEHHDKIMYARGSKNKQLVITMECATDFSWWTDAVHIKNTETATCWEIISVETMTNVLKIARFGNNYDHYMRHKGTLCYDFKNHKLISQY